MSGPQHEDPFAGLPETDARICDWVDGCLSERERDRFEAELRVNPQLRQQLEDYEATVADVRAALRAPIAEVPLADRVLARIASGDEVAATPRRQAPMIAALVAAAALLAVVVWVDDWAGRVRTDAAPVAAYDDPAAREGQRGPAQLEGQVRPSADEAVSVGAVQPRVDAESGRGDFYLGRAEAGSPGPQPPSGAPPTGTLPPAGAGPATGGPAVPSTRQKRAGEAVTGRAAEASVRVELPLRSRPALESWRQAVGATELEQARAWFAAEGLAALSAQRPAASKRTQLGAVTLTPIDVGPDGGRAWALAGARRDVAALVELFAAAAREAGGAVGRDAETPQAPADRLRVVLRVRAGR